MKTGYLYLLAVRATDGKIVAYFGPHQGAGSDLNVVYNSSFLSLREEDEWTFGDGIFKSLPRFICPQHSWGNYSDTDKVIVNIRASVEHINHRLKIFNILHHPFRHHKNKSQRHELVFRVICKIVNIDLLFHPIHLNKKPGLFYLLCISKQANFCCL